MKSFALSTIVHSMLDACTLLHALSIALTATLIRKGSTLLPVHIMFIQDRAALSQTLQAEGAAVVAVAAYYC
jgi:hypothetical protein